MIELKNLHALWGSEDLNLHQKIIDALPIPIFLRDRNGVYKGCNKAHEKFIGIPLSELYGKSLYDIQPEEIANLFSKRDKELFESPGDQIYETEFQIADGSIRNVIFYKSVIRDEKEEIIGIVGSIHDITQRKKAEEKLEKAQEASVIASAMLQKIRAGIVIVDKDLKIIESNNGFANIFGEDILHLAEAVPGLRGADLKNIVPQKIWKMFANLLETGEAQLLRDMRFHNKLLHISIVSIYRNKVVGAIIRDLSEPMLERAEIIQRAKEANQRNLDTVSRIAYLLGENASRTEELLNSIVEAYKYGEEEDEE